MDNPWLLNRNVVLGSLHFCLYARPGSHGAEAVKCLVADLKFMLKRASSTSCINSATPKCKSHMFPWTFHLWYPLHKYTCTHTHICLCTYTYIRIYDVYIKWCHMCAYICIYTHIWHNSYCIAFDPAKNWQRKIVLTWNYRGGVGRKLFTKDR